MLVSSSFSFKFISIYTNEHIYTQTEARDKQKVKKSITADKILSYLNENSLIPHIIPFHCIVFFLLFLVCIMLLVFRLSTFCCRNPDSFFSLYNSLGFWNGCFFFLVAGLCRLSIELEKNVVYSSIRWHFFR